MKSTIHYTGLTDEEVGKSRAEHGTNTITPQKKEPLWKLFLKEFSDPIIRILLIAAILSLITSIVENEYIETIGIFVTIFLATGVSFLFERNANKKFELLNQVNDDEPVTVIRNGDITQIGKKDVVVNDIVIVDIGEEVPADGELLKSVSLQMDESCLTGELSIDKTTDPKHFETNVAYASNRLMRGTKVINGNGVFKVTAVGDRTEFGKVAKTSTEEIHTPTPLDRKLDALAKFIGLAGLILAFITFILLFVKNILLNQELHITHDQLKLLGAVLVGVLVCSIKICIPIIFDGLQILGSKHKQPQWSNKISWPGYIALGIIIFILLSFIAYLTGVNPFVKNSWISIEAATLILQAFMVAVTLVVVAMPEGLPMSVTLSLALSMRRMLKMNNLVRKMHAVETMGAVTVICTDKTGTLTQNQMRIHETLFGGIGQDKDSAIWNDIRNNIALNSSAHLEYDDSDLKKSKVIGNPTEGAFLLWLADKGDDYKALRHSIAIAKQLPFSTERKYMATLIENQDSHTYTLYVKGAPEVILHHSTLQIDEEGNTIELDEARRISIANQLLGYQNKAMRTLAFACKCIDKTDIENELTHLFKLGGFTLQGIGAISDPVRPDVPEAVKQCLDAGIQIKIVTGDTIATAKEIGREIGIWDSATDNESNIIQGAEFENLSEEEAAAAVGKIKIMYRARPTDKQRLVRLLKDSGEVVAVTGDGTNDGPALNYADVGLSMGSGTSVAKDASDITLLDDSFKSIATAVMWGRSLYKNIQRFMLFQLTINFAAMLIVLLGSLLGHTLPLTVTQMLWVNLIMDTFAAGALASLPPDSDVMLDKPRSNKDFIVTHPILKRILITGSILVIILLGMIYYFADKSHLDHVFYYVAEANRERYFLSFFFTFFVMLQFWNLFNAKAFASFKSAFAEMKKSVGFELVACVIIIGQILIVTFGGKVFRTVPLRWFDWIIIIVISSFILWIGQLVHFISIKRKKQNIRYKKA